MTKDEPIFFCTVWEDNHSCIKVFESPKFTPCTKQIALKYHHSRQFSSNGTVNINPIGTLEQTADTLKNRFINQSLYTFQGNYVDGDHIILPSTSSIAYEGV